MKFSVEKIVFGKVELWVLVLVLFFALLGAYLFGWIAWRTGKYGGDHPNRFGASVLVEKMMKLPEMLGDIYKYGLEFDDQGRLVSKFGRFKESQYPVGYHRIDEGFHDDGYLLVGAFDEEQNGTVTYLYDLKEGKKLWKWAPQTSQIPQKKDLTATEVGQYTSSDFMAQHSYLLEDGRVLTSASYGPLVMLKPSGDVEWALPEVYHHTIERMADGNFLVVKQLDSGDDHFADDGYAIVSPEGELLEERSVRDILERHGYSGLLYGTRVWKEDGIHLNDAEPILESDEYVKEGDIALSCRNISTVFLYRPSEDKIVWLKTGPWLNQHDVDYLGDGVFSIFDNAAILGESTMDKRFTENFHNGNPYSKIRLYDMKDDSLSVLYEDVFSENKFYTHTEGLHRILDNGDAFVELTNEYTLFRLGPDGVRWSYVQGIYDDETAASLHWCRYLTRDEVDLSWMEEARSPEEPAP
ncbi:MAG: arylsulfotransferase family protein [Verrucomicrobiota bacterium]